MRIGRGRESLRVLPIGSEGSGGRLGYGVTIGVVLKLPFSAASTITRSPMCSPSKIASSNTATPAASSVVAKRFDRLSI